MRLLLGVVFALGIGVRPALGWQFAPPADSPERFGPVAEFSFVDSRGELVTQSDLLGAPWVAVPFFVRCSGPCPSLTTDLRAKVYDALEGTGARIVSFSVDPRFDDPEILAEYASGFDIDTERWLFLTGEEEAMQTFITGGLKVALTRDPDVAPEVAARATGDPGITHGTRLAVVDAEGQIAGWYEGARDSLGNDPADIDLAFERLLARVLALTDSPREARSQSRLPLLNAFLNGTAFVLLLLGWFAIRAGKRDTKKT